MQDVQEAYQQGLLSAPEGEGKRMTTKISVMAEILDTMSAGIQKGQTTSIAADNALEQIKKDDLLKEVWEQLGHTSLVQYWLHSTRRKRNNPWRNDEGRDVLGDRLADPSDVAEGIFDEPYNVDGKWINLGDFTQANCQAIIETYGQSIANDTRKQKFFKMAGQGLESGQIISGRYSVEEIYALIRESKQS